MKRLTPLSWIVLVAGLLGLVLSLAGCAGLKKAIYDRYHNADGSLNTRVLLQDANSGLEASCQQDQITLPAVVCTDGLAAIAAAQAFSTNDPVLFQKNAEIVLQTATHDHPELLGWFEFALKLLTPVLI